MKLLLICFFVSILLIVPISAEAKTYENEKYTFEYPKGCKLEKKENRFTTFDAILECKGDAGLTFESGVDMSEYKAILSDDNNAVIALENAMENIYKNVKIVESGTDKYIINDINAPYVIGTYDQEKYNLFGLTKTEPFVKMMVLIKLDDDYILVQYRNNEDNFDKQLPMVEEIFQSLKPVSTIAK